MNLATWTIIPLEYVVVNIVLVLIISRYHRQMNTLLCEA